MSKKKKKRVRKRKGISLHVQRLQLILFKLSIKCADALALDPEYYPVDKQDELRLLSTNVKQALTQCRAGVEPYIAFINEAIVKSATPSPTASTAPGFDLELAIHRLQKQLLG